MRHKSDHSAWEQEYYHLTEEQVKLIRELHFDWADGGTIGYDGGPCVNSKRPFGNSDVPFDICEILDPRSPQEIHDSYGDEEEYYDEVRDEMQGAYDRLYRTLAHALQVVVASGSFEPGIYRCDKYSRNYELVTDEKEIFKAKLMLGDGHAREDSISRY